MRTEVNHGATRKMPGDQKRLPEEVGVVTGGVA